LKRKPPQVEWPDWFIFSLAALVVLGLSALRSGFVPFLF
jgi:hypothetical protein